MTPLVVLNGGLLIKEGSLASSTSCCCDSFNPVCDCKSPGVINTLAQTVYTLTMSVSTTNSLVITGSGSDAGCDAQFGFAGSTMAQQAAWKQSWADYFNGLVGTLTRGVFVGGTGGVVFLGSTPWTTTPAGGLAQQYYRLLYDCGAKTTQFSDDARQLDPLDVNESTTCVTSGPIPKTQFFAGSWRGDFSDYAVFNCGQITQIGSTATKTNGVARVQCSLPPLTANLDPGCRRSRSGYWELTFFNVTFQLTSSVNPLP